MPNIEKSAIFTHFIFNMHLLHGINHKSFRWAWKNKPGQTRNHTFYRNQQFFKTDNCLGRYCRVPSNLIAFSYPCLYLLTSEYHISTNYLFSLHHIQYCILISPMRSSYRYKIEMIQFNRKFVRFICTIFKNANACSLSYLTLSCFAKRDIYRIHFYWNWPTFNAWKC